MEEFTILRVMGQVKGKVKTLNFRRVNFQLLKELEDGTPWKIAHRVKGAEQNWKLFRDIFSYSSRALNSHKKSSKDIRRPAWLSKILWIN